MSKGVTGSKIWADKISFNRVSWFQELTMLYDVMIVRLEKESPFRQWFSESELARVNECEDFLLALAYSLDTDRISHRMFINELDNHGYDDLVIPRFESNVRLHPDFERYNLKLYKVHGFCFKKKNSDIKPDETLPELDGMAKAGIVISFPGFENVTILGLPQ